MSDFIRFESFPNEIFFEIFDYFSLHQLYYSFHGLNQRMNYLLQSINHCAVRLWPTDNKNELELVEFFSPTIDTLIINDDFNINLNQYPKLNSLTYIYATDDQLQHFLQSESCHQHLTYLNITSDDLTSFMRYLFSNKFPCLQTCILRNIDSILKCPWRMEPSLSSITICDEKNLVPYILQSCPNLKRLSLAISRYSTIAPTLFISHQSLRHLSIEMIQPAWTIEAIKTLISSVELPYLISFGMHSYESSSDYFDFAQLTTIFHEQLPNLRRFHCNICVTEEVQIIDIKTIRNLHSSLFNSLKTKHEFFGIQTIYTSSNGD
ncbi:hypothetical protein I4U23_001299 [Adineta vaga]|nr:hypothetical protein I4U23_001299 [Adineta vaga]